MHRDKIEAVKLITANYLTSLQIRPCYLNKTVASSVNLKSLQASVGSGLILDLDTRFTLKSSTPLDSSNS